MSAKVRRSARPRVLFPPVDVDRFRGAGRLPVPKGLESRGYDLVLSALVPYKRIDLAVVAALFVIAALGFLGERTRIGADETMTIGLESCDVPLRGGVLPHLGMHGRRHQQRSVGGKDRRSEGAVGQAVGKT